MMTQTNPAEMSALFRRPAGARAGTNLVELLPGLLAAVARYPDAAATASAIAIELVDRLGARRATVYLADADEHTLRLAGSCNAPDAPHILDIFDGGGHVAATRAARTRLLYLESLGGDSTTTFAVPLLAGDRLLGAVSCELAARLEASEFTALDALGVVLGALVDRARREDEERARSEWSSLIAHELRQPLSSMVLQTSFVLSAVEDTPVAAVVHRMAGSVRRMNRLVDDLADAAQVDLRRIRLRRAPTDLLGLAERVADRGAPEATARIDVSVQGEIPLMPLDGDRIEQVLSNLLANAEKYGRASSRIRLALTRRIDCVQLSVTSDGPEIPERLQAQLFDRFYRAHDGATDGLGLGLYVCRGLVEAHGGTIGVRSGEGSTTFSVQLPLPRRSPSVASCSRCDAAQNGSPASDRR